MDVLGTVLRALRFSSAVFCRLTGGTPWGLSVPEVGGASFHIVLDGRCHVRSAVGDFELAAGDVGLVISGAPQVLSDAPDREATPLHELVQRMGDTGGITASLGPPPTSTVIVCGAFRFDRRVFDPLLAFVPPVLRLRPGDYEERLLGSILAGAAAELSRPRPASDLVLSRLGDLLFIEILRTAVDKGIVSRDRASWVRALRHPELLRVLDAVHGDLARKWSIDDLADRAHLSRSAFTARFREVVGMAPLQYLTHWRMAHAAGLLEDTTLPLAEIAASAGYTSEVAFAKAFKATIGVPPGRYRIDAQSPPR